MNNIISNCESRAHLSLIYYVFEEVVMVSGFSDAMFVHLHNMLCQKMRKKWVFFFLCEKLKIPRMLQRNGNTRCFFFFF